MDCKKALVATEGDFDAAVKFLREKGLASAGKKESSLMTPEQSIAVMRIMDEIRAQNDFRFPFEKE